MKTSNFADKFQNPNPDEENNFDFGFFKIVGFVWAAALVFLMFMQQPQHSTAAARPEAAASASQSQASTFPIEYFPAQFRNNTASDLREEHIQGF